MPLAFTRETKNQSLLLAKLMAEDVPPTCIPPLSQHSRYMYQSFPSSLFRTPKLFFQICPLQSFCGLTHLNPQLFILHMYQLCYSIFKVGSQRLHDPCSPNLSVLNLSFSSTPICGLPGITSSWQLKDSVLCKPLLLYFVQHKRSTYLRKTLLW